MFRGEISGAIQILEAPSEICTRPLGKVPLPLPSSIARCGPQFVIVPSEKQANLFVRYHDLTWIGLGLCAFAALTQVRTATAARHNAGSAKVVRQLLPAQDSRLRDLMNNRTSFLPVKRPD